MEGTMKRNFTTTLGPCLLVVALVVLAAAPAASAKAVRVPVTLSEAFVSYTPTAYWESGGVAHIEADNVFYDTSPTHDPMTEGYSSTHMYVVAKLVDGVPTAGALRGTVTRKVLDGSVWEGTFVGSMNVQTLTWDCICVSRCISGPEIGGISWGRNVKTDEGPFTTATLTGWYLAPHGM
jgi:hypothetical protein